MSSGAPASALFTSMTSPATGAYRSLAVLTDSMTPKVSPRVSILPTLGISTNTTSPSSSAAYRVMPTVPALPSARNHS